MTFNLINAKKKKSTWEQTISCGVTALKWSSLSFGTENSLQNYKYGVRCSFVNLSACAIYVLLVLSIHKILNSLLSERQPQKEVRTYPQKIIRISDTIPGTDPFCECVGSSLWIPSILSGKKIQLF